LCSILRDALFEQGLARPSEPTPVSHTGNAEAQPAEAAAGPSATSQAAPAEEEGDSIDPEFLAALPPEIQAEVLEQQRRERRMRERQRQQQQQAAAAAAQVSMHTCVA